MALSIKDPETERLARALSQITGENITTATRRAIEERLRRLSGQSRRAALLQDMADIRRRWSDMRIADDRSADEISDMTSTDCRADGDRYIRDRGHRS